MRFVPFKDAGSNDCQQLEASVQTVAGQRWESTAARLYGHVQESALSLPYCDGMFTPVS